MTVRLVSATRSWQFEKSQFGHKTRERRTTEMRLLRVGDVFVEERGVRGNAEDELLLI